jgi:hypothetical protein
MFHPDPDERFTLEKVEKSDWLTEKEDEEEVKEMNLKIERECERLNQIREGSILIWTQ